MANLADPLDLPAPAFAVTRARAELGAIAWLIDEAGFQPELAGGGCVILSRYFANGAHLWLTDTGGCGMPSAADWLLGVYGPDDNGETLATMASGDLGPDSLRKVLATAEHVARQIGNACDPFTVRLALGEGDGESTAGCYLHLDSMESLLRELTMRAAVFAAECPEGAHVYLPPSHVFDIVRAAGASSLNWRIAIAKGESERWFDVIGLTADECEGE